MMNILLYVMTLDYCAGGQPPEAICIARSDGDGFTDSALVV